MQARDEIGTATQVEAKGVNMVREEGRSEANLKGACTTQGRSSEAERRGPRPREATSRGTPSQGQAGLRMSNNHLYYFKFGNA